MTDRGQTGERRVIGSRGERTLCYSPDLPSVSPGAEGWRDARETRSAGK